MIIIRKEDLTTATWSGGTTTQIAISPEGAVYADRDFDWRLSTAEVNDEKSTFTPLPDYNRFLTIRKGEVKLKHDDGEWYTIGEGDVAEFDGGSITESEGRVTDFNLMVRKGKIEGSLDTEFLEMGEDALLAAKYEGTVTAIYLSGGESLFVIYDGNKPEVLHEGDLIIFEESDTTGGLSVRAGGDVYFMRADIRRI